MEFLSFSSVDKAMRSRDPKRIDQVLLSLLSANEEALRAPDKDGRTLLHAAAVHGLLDWVPHLKENPKLLMVADKDGNSAAHYASINRSQAGRSNFAQIVELCEDNDTALLDILMTSNRKKDSVLSWLAHYNLDALDEKFIERHMEILEIALDKTGETILDRIKKSDFAQESSTEKYIAKIAEEKLLSKKSTQALMGRKKIVRVAAAPHSKESLGASHKPSNILRNTRIRKGPLFN